MGRVLIVDDEPAMREVLRVLLSREGFEVEVADGLSELRERLAEGVYGAVLSDHVMVAATSLEVIEAARAVDATLPVIVVTAYATVDLALEVMERGAFDFITKPFIPAAVVASVRRASESARLARENRQLRQQVARLTATRELIGESAEMREAKEHIRKVAPTDATVLIQGETGTGKELAAKALHSASPRGERPFVAVNCAALSDSLLESELFGHERGAFTGADRARQGVFEAADGGTLFLDEAGEMTLPLQAKLLRVLMDGEVTRVGASRPRKVDVRVLVATHRDLGARVKEGLFREDLFYRLNVFPITLPPLRKRRADIPLLLQHFLTWVAVDLKVRPSGIAPQALELLQAYRFPGNVRELRNLIERAYILAQGQELSAEHFPLSLAVSASGEVGTAELKQIDWVDALPERLDLRRTLRDAEVRIIRRALRLEGGNQAAAARRLAVSRSDLNYKIKSLEIPLDRPQG